MVSTHDLTKRSTTYAADIMQYEYMFQLTTSRRGRHYAAGEDVPMEEVSTHDLTKRSTHRFFLFSIFWKRFNSRPHEEVDLTLFRLLSMMCVFQLTTSRRGRRNWSIGLIMEVLFQLTTSRRGRPGESAEWGDNRGVSTHDLTKRSTLFREKIVSCLEVSTHDLTKRSTLSYYKYSLYLTFQLTTSRRGRQQFLRKKFSFQNHFLCSLHIIYSYYINTIFFSTLFLAKSSFFLVRIL